MPNGDEFKAVTPELQREYQTELERELARVREYFLTLPLSERTVGAKGFKPKFGIKYLETQATQTVTERFQRLSSIEELRLDIESGEFVGLPPATAASYFVWKDTESRLIREQATVEAGIRTSQLAMEAVGKPNIFTDAVQFFYKKFGPIPFIDDPGAAGAYEEALALYNAGIARLGEIAKETGRAKVYQSLYEALGAYIQAGRVSSYDDLFTLEDAGGTPITIFQELGRDDATLMDIFNQVSSVVLGLPRDTSMKELNYNEMIAELAKKPEGVSPTGISPLTVNAIIQSLGTPVPEFPAGFRTIDEVLEGYSKAGVPDELVAELEGLESYVNNLEKFWQSISANQVAILNGLKEATLPEIGIGALLLQTISQPALTALDLFGKFYSEWVAPWGAMLYRFKYTYTRLPGVGLTDREKEFEVLYNEAKLTDDWWHAGAKAFAETELGFLDRLVFEWILDPVSWLGMGLGKGIMVLGKSNKFVRGIGATINIFDRAWLKSWDILIFDRIKHLGRLIQKTAFQSAISYAGRDMIAVANYLIKKTGATYYSKVPLAKAKDALKEAMNWRIHHPEDPGDMARAGEAMLRQNALDESHVVELGKRLGYDGPISKEMVLDINAVTNGQLTSSAGQVLTRKTTPAFILRSFDLPDTGKLLKLARREINKLFQQGRKNAYALIDDAEDVPDLLARVFNQNHSVYLDMLEATAAHNLEMSGRVASMVSRIEWKVMNVWRNTLDMWVVTPGARMYLAFSAYGPFNVIEGFIKQAMAQQIPYNPLRLLWKSKPVSVVNPTVRGQRLMAGLSKPLELETAIPRIEMAGETITFRLMENLSPEGQVMLRKWRSILSGGPIGRFFIDLPGRLGVHQRWDYYRKMFTSFLGDEEASAVMSVLAKNIDDAVKKLPDDVLKNLNITKSELRSELLDRSVMGPAATRNLLDDMIADRLLLAEDVARREARKHGKKIGEKAVSADQALSDRIAGGKVGEAVGKYPLVPQPFTDDLILSASDGSLWAKAGGAIDGKIDDYTAAMYDYFVHTPEFYGVKYKEFADITMGREIRNIDEFNEVLSDLKHLRGFYTDSSDDVIRAMNELESRMAKQMKVHEWNEWRGQYTVEVYEGMGRYADVADAEFERIVRKLRESLAYASPGEQVSINKLMSAWTDEQRFLRDFWKKRRAKEIVEVANIKTLHGEARSKAWAKFRDNQDAAHALRREQQAPFHTAVEKQEFYTSEALGTLGFYPPTIDATGRKLAKMDIATLFHSHPQQMGHSMLRLETMTLKSRRQFVGEVRAQADIMAQRAGKASGAEMGFTDDGIGDVYDEVLRDMYMSPEAASVLEPHLMELKALQDEMWSIYNTKGLPKGTADELQGWLDDLGDVLDDVPGYATPKVKEPKFVIPTELPLTTISKYETRIPLDLIRKDEKVAIAKLTEDVKARGIVEPVVIRVREDGSTVLWDGMHRLIVAEDLGLKVVPVRYIGEVGKLVTGTEPARIPRALSPEFSSAKQRAADKASKEYYKDWADYTNENASTALMRTVYPFWTYELHRLFWLPRASVRTPGLFKAWGTYMDNTDFGYMHIPGTSLEANPLRGTIFMGGMVRLIRKDYPEYYDRFPGVSEFFDFYSRYGFYPATYLNFLKMFGGKTIQGKANFGEILPAWVKTPLNTYIALQPDSAAAKLLLDTVLPEPFRDYTTVLVANAICQRERKTFNGMDILDKRAENTQLTPEEEEVWTRAIQNQGWMGALMEQAGIIRIRTEEQIAAWEASGKMIQELTGLTLEDQLWIRRHGFRVGDYAQLDPLGQALLGEMDAMKYHSGIFNTLMPTAWQDEDRRRREFFDEIRAYSEARKLDQEELDRQARAGELNMRQWASAKSKLSERNANFFKDLSETDRYRNVAIDMEDIIRPDGTVREGMITRAKDRDMLPPIEHPAKEILNAYYSIELEKKVDPASGNLVDDWDGYFQKIDTIINALRGTNRDDLIEMITKNMTDLVRLRWEVSRRYFRGYNRRQTAILLTQFSDEEQAIIMRWTFGTPTERDEMREVEIDGKKVVSSYQEAARVTGQNLRMLSPELDAWLQFFEITDATLTDAATELYSQYRREWGIPE